MQIAIPFSATVMTKLDWCEDNATRQSAAELLVAFSKTGDAAKSAIALKCIRKIIA